MPKAGGIFVEAAESAQPEILEEQEKSDREADLGIKTVEDIKRIIHDADTIQDKEIDKEVQTLVGEKPEEETKPIEDKNEHRKTPNRFEILENGESAERTERNLDELRKSVDRIVQNLEKNIELEHARQNLTNHIEETDVKIKNEDEKKFNLFEKLGQCMERENRNDEELKTEIKEEMKNELKNEILNELKTEIKHELKMESDEDKGESEHKWFSILPKDGATCDGVVLTAGNRWDSGVGVCIRENVTELKIPVFPPPNSSSGYVSFLLFIFTL